MQNAPLTVEVWSISMHFADYTAPFEEAFLIMARIMYLLFRNFAQNPSYEARFRVVGEWLQF